MVAVQQNNYFQYGDIIIAKDQLINFSMSTTIPNLQSERVQYPIRILNKGNDIDVVKITLRLSETELLPWLDYFNNAPNDLQRDLLIGNWTSLDYAIQSMSIEYTDFVILGNGQTMIIYNVDLEFIRSI